MHVSHSEKDIYRIRPAEVLELMGITVPDDASIVATGGGAGNAALFIQVSTTKRNPE